MTVEVTRLPSGLTIVTDAMAHLETAALGETFKAVTSSAFTAYLAPLILFTAAAAALGWGWSRHLKRELPPVVHLGGQLIALSALGL